MKIRTQSLYIRTRWLKQPMQSGAYRTWLIDRGSLTQRLQVKSKHFNVRALILNRAKPQIDEAKILNIPIGTVRSRLHRARALLKDSLATYAKSKGYGADTLSDLD